MGALEQRAQALVLVRDPARVGLVARVVGDELHRPRPVQRVQGDQVLELGRLHQAQGVAHAGRLELEDARGVAPGHHRVGRAVVEGQRVHVEPHAAGLLDHLDGAVDHVQVAQAEEVHLEQPERIDVAHRELGHDLGVGALLLQRQVLGQRPVADHDGGGVDGVVAYHPFERRCHVDDLLGDLVGVVGAAQLRAGLHALREGDLGHLRHELGDAVDHPVGDPHHAARVLDRRLRLHLAEGDDLRHVAAAVLLGDVVDHALAAGHGEVDVDVRHGLSARVQEALEEQRVADRVEIGDVQAVGDERPGGRPAARPDRDAVGAGEADEVPHDQEVVGEAHLLDRLQLELEPAAQLGVSAP